MTKRAMRCTALLLAAAVMLCGCGGMPAASDTSSGISEEQSSGPASAETSEPASLSGDQAPGTDSSDAEASPGGDSESPEQSGEPEASETGESSQASGSLQEAETGSQATFETQPEAASETQAAAQAVTVTKSGSSVRVPYAAGTVTYSGYGATIDASNASQGYVMCAYSGSASRVKVQVTKSGGTTYTYNLNTRGSYEAFSFSMGSGSYTVNIYENVSGSSYALCVGQTIDVSLAGGMLPFLYANQFVNFWSGSSTVAVGDELARTASSDLQVVENVYNYVINNLSYDFGKASSVSSGYVPSVDSTLSSGYGICFDYAAVMAAMLRTQNIPTKLVVGYAGSIYHAWISVYITDVGWVNGIIQFDGQSWKRMDPTFADNGNQSSDIMAFIGNGNNYNAMYFY